MFDNSESDNKLECIYRNKGERENCDLCSTIYKLPKKDF